MNRILAQLQPSEIKNLSLREREVLCEELRETIISTVSSCGGHLSSNLGVVELTVGLFTVFNFPDDKIVWDVGHQCYAYKLLSGRYKRFHTLRKKDGISGFPKRQESVFDSYNTGHAGNSVSAAIGLKKACELTGNPANVIAVIGDGSFNNGLIYEALNSLPIFNSKILIVLNDNNMSISPTVGATHELLSKSQEDNQKNIALIEQYGVQYMGNVNGNDLQEVTNALQEAKEKLQTSSVLLHIKTKKGAGYGFCEENPMQTHGVAPENAKQEQEYSKLLGEKMIELAQKDSSVVAVTAAMTDALGLREFFNRFPERSFDVGICEENAAVLCAGMAGGGLKPYYAIYSTFLQRAFDEIIHDICAQDLPVTFCIDRGGLSGSDGETHQGVFDLSYLSLIPNMTVAVPKDGEELKQMLELSLDYAHPLAIRYPRSAKHYFASQTKPEVGTFEYLTQKTNSPVTLLACGERAIAMAFSVRERTNVHFDIVNARYVKPLDSALLSAITSKHIVTLEDNASIGGLGSQINKFYQNSGKTVQNYAYADTFIPQGGIEELQREYGLNEREIADYILSL
ncbi:MAG: 1-deoxy-D-xylulose-5-phosphate synthase [Clostridia bacterium]|nr:1-deoxy-D-xylulose-5-phosphate synthase [Clostridia bacterium]